MIEHMLSTAFRFCGYLGLLRCAATTYGDGLNIVIRTENPCVGSSILPLTTPLKSPKFARNGRFRAFLVYAVLGRFPSISAHFRPFIEQMLSTMVYFIQQGADGPIKIGYTASDDAGARLSSLQTGNPYPLRVIGTLPDGAYKLESSIHDMFAATRLCGEWFENTEELRFYIKAIMNPYEYQIHNRRPVLVRWCHGSNDDPEAFIHGVDLCPFCGYACSASEGYNTETSCYNHNRKYVEIPHPDGTRIHVEDGVIIKHRVNEFATDAEIQDHVKYTRYANNFRNMLSKDDWIKGELYSRSRRRSYGMAA